MFIVKLVAGFRDKTEFSPPTSLADEQGLQKGLWFFFNSSLDLTMPSISKVILESCLGNLRGVWNNGSAFDTSWRAMAVAYDDLL